MSELSRYVFLAGSLPFLVLGAAHARATPLTPDRLAGLSPADAAVREAMPRTALLLTSRTNLWLAWVGFNLSHSLGALVFAVVVILVGRSPAAYASQAAVFLPLAALVAAAYLALAVKYWFRIPIAGVGLSLALFVIASLLFALERRG